MNDLLAGLLDERCDADRSRYAEERLRAVSASARAGDRRLVGMAEDLAHSRGPAAFEWDPTGTAYLRLGEHRWSAGRFETPTIGGLVSRLPRSSAVAKLRFTVLEGASPLTDIGALQGMAGPDTLFQVASQFNCLESPTPNTIMEVRDYFTDYTQGPRASISGFNSRCETQRSRAGFDRTMSGRVVRP